MVSVRPNARHADVVVDVSVRYRDMTREQVSDDGVDLDAGTTKVFIEADTERVQCRTHGPTVAQVPWARHDIGHTRDFDAITP